MNNIHHFPGQDCAAGGNSFGSLGENHSSAVEEKLKELQAWTICYNRELSRLTRELNELRAREADAA
jgi:hypothetical protein